MHAGYLQSAGKKEEKIGGTRAFVSQIFDGSLATPSVSLAPSIHCLLSFSPFFSVYRGVNRPVDSRSIERISAGD